jgi:Calcineurin-like phosphoesterase
VERLLKKVSFDQTAGDHLIFTGDMISKGPDSAGVVDIARDLGASCVRGNHEDRILLLRSEMKLHNILSPASVDRNETAQSDVAERKIARELSDEQAAWLQECPVMLKLGSVNGMGDVVVVHGGLVPGVPLERQELTSVMSMRTIDLETHVPSSAKDGVPWFKVSSSTYHYISSAKKKHKKKGQRILY